MKFDDLLLDIGEFGLYQKRLYALLVVPAVFDAMQLMNYIFILGSHKYWFVSNFVGNFIVCTYLFLHVLWGR